MRLTSDQYETSGEVIVMYVRSFEVLKFGCIIAV